MTAVLSPPSPGAGAAGAEASGVQSPPLPPLPPIRRPARGSGEPRSGLGSVLIKACLLPPSPLPRPLLCMPSSKCQCQGVGLVLWAAVTGTKYSAVSGIAGYGSRMLTADGAWRTVVEHTLYMY